MTPVQYKALQGNADYVGVVIVDMYVAARTAKLVTDCSSIGRNIT